MTTNYQLVFLGANNSYRNAIETTFYQRVKDLGIDTKVVKLIDATNFHEYQASGPAFGLYFGDPGGKFPDVAQAQRLVSDAKLILPVVDDLKNFTAQVPPLLRTVNGFALEGATKIEPLVSVILEGFNLLRIARRLFISYRRDDSREVAVQLFEELESAGFDVFLDTHSIRPAQPFQDELWHRLVDTDVVVLLNTPNYMGSPWTTEELARASAMSVGIVQLIWPKDSLHRDAELTVPVQLTDSDFGNPKYLNSDKYLSPDMLKEVVSQVEALRARSLAARQAVLINEFIAIAGRIKAAVSLQAAKYLLVEKKNGNYLAVVPTIGIPQAFTYYQTDQLLQQVTSGQVDAVYLLYDHLYIREEWLRHLHWLDGYLKVRSLRIDDAEKDLPTLI